jgi:hypothetical protein
MLFKLLSTGISDELFFFVSNSPFKLQLAVCCVIVWGATWRRKCEPNNVPGSKEMNIVMESRVLEAVKGMKRNNEQRICPLCGEEEYWYGILRSYEVRDLIFGRMDLCHSRLEIPMQK